MRLTKYVQSTVSIEHEGALVLIDPGKYNFEDGRYEHRDFTDVDVLIITHSHGDHFDLEATKHIYGQCSCPIFTVDEVARILREHGISAEVLAVGSSTKIAGITITATEADHVVRGEVIDVFGVLLEASEGSVYHAADTMYLENKPYADIVFVPINNRGVSMGIEDAARFVREIAPKAAVPIHYDSPKDQGRVDPYAFAEHLSNTEIDVRVLEIGESFQFAA